MAALTAAGIVAGLGSAGASVYGASQAGKGNDPKVQTIPAPPYATALQRYMTRIAAANAQAKAPSMLDFIQSGGTARLNLADTGFTPDEAQHLGFVDSQGGRQPFYDPLKQSQLTVDQQLFIGDKRRNLRAQGKLKGTESLQERHARLLAQDRQYKEALAAGGLRPKERNTMERQAMETAGRLYATQQQLFGDAPQGTKPWELGVDDKREKGGRQLEGWKEAGKDTFDFLKKYGAGLSGLGPLHDLFKL